MTMLLSPKELSSNYPVYRCHVSEFSDLVDLEFPSPNSILFVAADFDAIGGEQMLEISKKLIAKGCAYFCAWGDGCDPAEDNWNFAAAESDAEETFGFQAMTTAHDEESLEEAAWFALNCAWVDEAIIEKTSIVLVSVKYGELEDAIGLICADPEAFNQRELEEEGVVDLIDPENPQINGAQGNE